MYMHENESLEKSRCKTVWMGPIPKNTTRAQILDFFREYNPITCKIIKKSESNIFSFIYFPDENTRDMAIQGKKGCTFKGENVVVNRSFNAYTGEKLGGRERLEYVLDGEFYGDIDILYKYLSNIDIDDFGCYDDSFLVSRVKYY